MKLFASNQCSIIGSLLLLVAGCAFAQTSNVTKIKVAGVPRMIIKPSSSPLYTVRIMVMAGSVDDPAGKEGVSSLLAQTLMEGGFGDPKAPTTKEKLAEITRPWGADAMPTVRVDKQTTTFVMTVPRDVFPQFVSTVLKPMLSRPLLRQAEVDRLRTEALTSIESRLRMEQQEMLGLEALETYLFQGTPLAAPSIGTVRGLKAITRDDLLNYYKTFYTSKNIAIATNADAANAGLLRTVVPQGLRAPKQMCDCAVQPLQGREVLIVTQPNALATGIHLGFPISVKQGSADYWPLFVANTYLGTHRDSFGRLYQEIREERGYNYGNYSYIEYLPSRPYQLFPPPNAPRTKQYFSIWVRPVGNQYAHFVLKAVTAELERFIRDGLAAAQVEEAKIKARTLYLNYAENTSRQLGYRLDDTFYGVRIGYLEGMLKNIDAVTPEQVNAAIRKHLQVADLRYVITTNEKYAAQLAGDIAAGTNATPKTLEEYHIATPVPPEKQRMLDQDKQWIAYPLNIRRERIHIVRPEQMFETSQIPLVQTAGGDGK